MKLSLEETDYILELDERRARISQEEALELVAEVGSAWQVSIKLTWTKRRRRGMARVGADINTIITGPLAWRGSLHSTIHELGHVANYETSQSRGHGRDFYHALKGVILICGLNWEDYSWKSEYPRIRRWADREGLIKGKKEEETMLTLEQGKVKAEATQAPKVEEKAKREKKDHGKATHSIEFTPEVKQRKKAKSVCSYSKDGKPGGYRLVWTYEDGLKTFCKACIDHAKRFSERHGCPIPQHPRTKKGKA